jgi:hypothetical protein
MALFDDIQDRLRQQQQSLAAGGAVPPGTQQALGAAAQAGTGRATSGGVPRASNVGEQTAQAAAGAQSAQLASRVGAAADRLATQTQAIDAAADAGTAKLRAQQSAFDTTQSAQAASRAATRAAATQSLATSLAGQEQRGIASATQQFTNKSADLASEGRAATDDVFAQFRQGTQELAFRQDQAQLEQVAQRLALQDKSYVDELNRIGTLRRLDDDNNWRSEMQRLTLGDKLSDVIANAKFTVDLNADQRAWDEQMSQLNSDTAWAVFQSELQSKNAGQTVQGLSGLAKTAVSAYQKPAPTTPAGTGSAAELPESTDSL